jgi:aminoacrylate hydrolase
MPRLDVAGCDLYYEVHGAGDPVVLLTGLSGNGSGWGAHIRLFAEEFLTIVPDHPGAGRSANPSQGFSIANHAAAMAELIRQLECGPAHIVGSSTGGAIALAMALDHPDVVRSIGLTSAWARADDHFRHQFAVRKEVLDALGKRAYADVSALFLFSPRFFRDHYEIVTAWRDTVAEGSSDPANMSARIDMILAYDELARLGSVDVPALVLVGRDDSCTPPQLSEELADGIPGSEFVVMDGGHLIYKEAPEEFHRLVAEFIRSIG